MIEVVLLLIGITIGMISGIAALFALMGKKLRDQFLGRGEKDDTLLAIDWIDGRNQDIAIKMSGTIVFIGKILTMNIHAGLGSASEVDIKLVSKAAFINATRS